MANILVIDDAPFWRDLASDGLRLKGHTVSTANDGLTGLALLKERGADLIVLDVEMPQLEGLAFLEHIHSTPQWKALPVIMLTGDVQKDRIVRAKSLGASDYLLKPRFSLTELVDRVQRRLAEATEKLAPIDDTTATIAADAFTTPPPVASCSRQQCLERAEKALGMRSLSGIVLEIITAAMSPRTDMADLAVMVGRDAILAARVLGTANKVSNASNRGVISTLSDAVRILGSAAVRDVAASVGVFEAMPDAEHDGFNPIRCWQHSIAVATLCSRLAPHDCRSSAYLVGLCHDLGEVLFRTHFGAEYRQVLYLLRTTTRSRVEIELELLGMTHAELADIILRKFGLPDCVQAPIAAFHKATSKGGIPSMPEARLLQICDLYACGLMMSSDDQSSLRPLTRPECRAATGSDSPPVISGPELRSDVYMLTSQYARLSAAQQAKLIKPRFCSKPTKIYVVADDIFSPLNPIAAAIQSLADDVTVATQLPAAKELQDRDLLVTIARDGTSRELGTPRLTNLQRACPNVRVLQMVATLDCHPPENLHQVRWPIPLTDLAQLVA